MTRTMDYGTITGVRKPVARLVLGTMIISTGERERSYRLLDDAFERGFTTLDTANVYAGGDSERCIGDWMRDRANRDQVVIVTKGAHPNADRRRVTPYDIGADILDSLARLKTDYIDIYLLHRDDLAVPVGEIVDALDEHYRAGRIRSYGGSNWTHTRLADANAYAETHNRAPMVASSPNYSLAEQVRDPWGDNSGSVSLSGPENIQARAWYTETQMPVLAWSSLARGFFAGRYTSKEFAENANLLDGAAARAYLHERNYLRLDRAFALAAEKNVTLAQIAMEYVLRDPMNVFPIVGAANRTELESNLTAAQIELSSDERAWLNLEVPEH